MRLSWCLSLLIGRVALRNRSLAGQSSTTVCRKVGTLGVNPPEGARPNLWIQP